jgi:hypothetical protein
MIGFLGAAATTLLRRLDPEDAHRLTIEALRLLPKRAPAPEQGFWARLSQPARPCRRLR